MWCQGLARSTTIFFQLLLTCAVSAACSSDPEEPGPATGITTAEYCRKVAENVCADLAGCCSVSVAACVDAHRSNCEESAQNATTRGLSFNADAAQLCAEGVRGLGAGIQLGEVEDGEGIDHGGSLPATGSARGRVT